MAFKWRDGLDLGRKIVAIGRNYGYPLSLSFFLSLSLITTFFFCFPSPSVTFRLSLSSFTSFFIFIPQSSSFSSSSFFRSSSEHAKELGNQVPQEMFFFLKPTSSIIKNGDSIEIPFGAEVHHEGLHFLFSPFLSPFLYLHPTLFSSKSFPVELGVIIGKGGRDIRKEDALSHIDGYCLALDMTARNFQNVAKKAGLPWSAAKGYDTFCPVSSYIPKSKVRDPQNLNLWLKVNNEARQNGNTSDMIFKIDYLIAKVSTIMTLEPGDLILTGTPSGVGVVRPGDVVTSGLADLVQMRNPVVARAQSKI